MVLGARRVVLNVAKTVVFAGLFEGCISPDSTMDGPENLITVFAMWEAKGKKGEGSTWQMTGGPAGNQLIAEAQCDGEHHRMTTDSFGR